jgi:hypothetical protein
MLMNQLDACQDMKPWTNEMARSWWNEQGASVLAYARRRRVTTGDLVSSPTGSSLDVSFIRPAIRGTQRGKFRSP